MLFVDIIVTVPQTVAVLRWAEGAIVPPRFWLCTEIKNVWI